MNMISQTLPKKRMQMMQIQWLIGTLIQLVLIIDRETSHSQETMDSVVSLCWFVRSPGCYAHWDFSIGSSSPTDECTDANNLVDADDRLFIQKLWGPENGRLAVINVTYWKGRVNPFPNKAYAHIGLGERGKTSVCITLGVCHLDNGNPFIRWWGKAYSYWTAEQTE